MDPGGAAVWRKARFSYVTALLAETAQPYWWRYTGRTEAGGVAEPAVSYVDPRWVLWGYCGGYCGSTVVVLD